MEQVPVQGHPPLVGAGTAAVADALAAGAIVAVPGAGSYNLVVCIWSPDGEARLDALVADPEGPHYAVGHRDTLRLQTSRWSDELSRLLERCWPGPLEVLLPWAAAGAPHAPGGSDERARMAVVSMPESRALRRLCRERGPWRMVPLHYNEATEVARAYDVSDVAFVIDGGRREGLRPTIVDATTSPLRVTCEGALPQSFIEASLLMSMRRRLFPRTKRPPLA